MNKFTKWLDSLEQITEDGRQYSLIPVDSKRYYLSKILDCEDNHWFYDLDTQSYWVRLPNYATNMAEIHEANYGKK